MVVRFAPRLIAVYVTSLALAACQTSLQDDYSLDDLDDYQIYERGYDTFEDEAIDKTYFNPYEGDYVDPYSESILQKITVTTDCQIAADGSATFNGVAVFRGCLKLSRSSRYEVERAISPLQAQGLAMLKCKGSTSRLPS